MYDWNFDMAAAPRGRMVKQKVGKKEDAEVFVPEKVILASKCGIVTVGYYIPREDRWCMFATGEMPVAWFPYPEHPLKTPANTEISK